MKRVTLAGISAPVQTPFKEDGTVNLKEYTRLIRYISENGVQGVFVGGTSGEFINLRTEEREQLLLAAKEGVEKDTTVLFNVTAMNEAELVRLMDGAKKYQADAVSVTAPYYHRYDQTALIQYFRKVCEIAEGMPVYFYNMSGMTNNPITVNVLKAVKETCPNLYGIKDSSMDFMTLLDYEVFVGQEKFEIITGNDAQVLSALQSGAAGGIIATASVFPKLAVKIWSAYKENDMEEAWRAQRTILQIRDLFRSVMPIGAHKEALKIQGYQMGPMRFPFRDLTEEERSKIKNKLYELGCI